MEQMNVDSLIALALKEDIGDGDHTTLATIPEGIRGKVRLLVKEDGILAGVEVARAIYRQFDPSMVMQVLIHDGSPVKKGDVAFFVEGPERSLLTTERLVLNFMQRMSGIATETHKYVSRLSGLNTKILDTRKTTPNMRWFEKLAVRTGGGENHRMGLYDMIMIKDNHVDFSGGIANAIHTTKTYLERIGKDLKIEIEVRNFAELAEVLATGGIHRIMLDNFNTTDLKEAVKLIGGCYETEASGGITYSNIREYAECGVDYISVGALTHQIKSLDLSLKAVL